MRSSYHLCRILARHYEIHSICFATVSELSVYTPENYTIFASQEFVPVSNRVRLLGAMTAPVLPFAISARNSAKFRSCIRHEMESQSFDAVLLDHTAMWQYARLVGGIPVICGIAHDVLSQQWQRRTFARGIISGLVLRAEAVRIRRWEAKVIRELGITVPFCEKDAELLRGLAPGHKVQTIQPWFSNFAQCRISDRPHRGRNLLFWGALDRPENQDCVTFILNQILPIIQKSVPDVHFYIAGVASDSLKSTWARPNVTVTGYVDDVGELFAQMDVALLPLRLGAGIKIKVLETMSAGIPVVTSSVGIEGIPALEGSEFLLGGNAEEYAAHTTSLLLNSAMARLIASNAKEFIRRTFDFEAAAEKFSQVINQHLV